MDGAADGMVIMAGREIPPENGNLSRKHGNS
jgi:hypothetical protein